MLPAFRLLAKELPAGALYLLWILLLVGTAGFHLGIPVGPRHTVVALVIYLLLCALLFRKLSIGCRIAVFILPVVWMLGAGWLVGKFLDFSVDGTQYHQEALIQLKKGWNPFRETIVPDNWDLAWAVWLNSLPKVAWLLGSELSQTIGVFESAKFLCVFLMPFLFLLGYSTSREYFGRRSLVSSAVGVSLALHPIAASQFLTNYMDGYVSLFALMSLTFFLRYLRTQGSNERNLFALSLILAGLVKFTNLFFACAAFATLLFTINRRTRSENLRIFVTLGLGAFIGVVVCGFNPYVTNFIRYGTLNYPMSHHAWVKTESIGRFNNLPQGVAGIIYSAHLPVGFDKKTRVQTFFQSLFSKSEHASGSLGTASHFKTPLSFEKGEWEYLAVSDGRIAGLGPLFSAIFLLALFGIILFARGQKDLGLLAGSLVIAAMANPFGWWGRYIGFLWGLIPLSLLLVAGNTRQRPRLAQFLLITITCLTVANSLPIALIHARHARRFTNESWAKMNDQFATKGFVVIDAYFGGIRETLFEHKMAFLGQSYENTFVENQLRPIHATCFSNVYRWSEWKDPRYQHLPPMHNYEREAWIKGISMVNVPIDPSPLFSSRGEFTLDYQSPLGAQKACAEAFLFHQKLGFSKAPIF